MRDLFSDLKATPCFTAAVATQAANPTAIAIDRDGFESVVFEFTTGAGGITFTGTNKIEWTLTHCDTVDGSYVAVPEADVQLQDGESYASGGIVRSIVSAHAAQTVRKVGYIGNKRFTKFAPVFGGTHATGTLVAATALLGHAHSKPVA